MGVIMMIWRRREKIRALNCGNWAGLVELITDGEMGSIYLCALDVMSLPTSAHHCSPSANFGRMTLTSRRVIPVIFRDNGMLIPKLRYPVLSRRSGPLITAVLWISWLMQDAHSGCSYLRCCNSLKGVSRNESAMAYFLSNVPQHSDTLPSALMVICLALSAQSDAGVPS
jgi:hypothetical protein